MSKSWEEWVGGQQTSVVVDGGLGEILTMRGNNLSEGSLWSGRLLVTDPEEIAAVAKLWLEAGVDLITTVTYQITIEKVKKEFDFSEEEAIETILKSVKILTKARDEFWDSLSEEKRKTKRFPIIAISHGPLTAATEGINEYSIECANISHDQFVKFHKQKTTLFANIQKQNDELKSMYCFETIGSTSEALAIVEIMSEDELRDIPYWISFQCRDTTTTASGDLLQNCIVKTLKASHNSNLVAVGVNCVSIVDIKELMSYVHTAIDQYRKETQSHKNIMTIAYPNSGEVWKDDGWKWEDNDRIISPSRWAEIVQGCETNIVGGCCRVGFEHTQALRKVKGEI